MAPVAPVGRARALAAVRAGTLPLWMGSPHPFVAIVEQDDRFRLRRLVVDADEAEAARRPPPRPQVAAGCPRITTRWLNRPARS
jgi:hypothetical protein